MTQLLRLVFWIAAAVLGFLGWLSRAHWTAELRWMIVAALVVALLGLAVWFAMDWRRGFDRHDGPPGPAR